MHYRLIGKGEIGPHNLFQVQATQSIGKIKKGMLGGFVCSPNNLAQDGTAWIGEGVKITDPRVRIRDNAKVSTYDGGSLEICGDTTISGNTKIVANGSITGLVNYYEGNLNNLKIEDTTIKNTHLEIITAGEIYNCFASLDDLDIKGCYIKITGLSERGVQLKGALLVLHGNIQIYGQVTVEVAKVGLISGEVYIYDHAKIKGNFYIKDQVNIGDNTSIQLANGYITENVTICGNARIVGQEVVISNSASIGDNAIIKGTAYISDNAQIYGNSVVNGGIICGNAKLTGEAKVTNGFVRYNLNKSYNRSKEVAMQAATGLLPDENNNYRLYTYALKVSDNQYKLSFYGRTYTIGQIVHSTDELNQLQVATLDSVEATSFIGPNTIVDEGVPVILLVSVNKQDIRTIGESIAVTKVKILREV